MTGENRSLHSMKLSFSDEDLQSYVEGGLSSDRRAAIAGYLACNPDLAARVMQALHQRERAQSMVFRTQASRRRKARSLGIVIAYMSCAVAGWALAEGMDDDGPFRDLSSTPEYVDDAIMSQRVAHVRIAMHSQVETPKVDSAEIEHATRIRLPLLPEDLRLLDAQVYPSEGGPSVSVMMESGLGKRLNLFAVRADTAATGVPTIVKEKGQYVAFWEIDGAAYVLTGDVPPAEIRARAAELSRNRLM